MIALLVAFTLLFKLAVANKPAFGTERGYDVGGDEAMCWVTNLTGNNETRSNDVGIETLNEALYGDGESAQLLPACFAGTNLRVDPLDLDEERRIITGIPYTFQLNLTANITEINKGIVFEALQGNSTIHARLQLCDAIKSGFCSPLWDSRAIEDNLVPAQTDLNSSYTYPEGNKWKYKEGDTLLGVSKGEGVLVFSRWVKWTLRELSPNNTAYETSVDITFQLPHNMREGAYFFIGHAVMQFDLEDSVQRIDVAAALPENVAEVRNPPNIQTVSKGMKIGLGVAIGIFGSLALAMFVFIVYHRDHPAMKLAQGPFLAAMTLACFVQTVCSFLFLPTKDIHCELAGIFVLVPMTFVGACLVGRVWRVYSTLGVAQSFARLDKKKKCDMSQCLISSLSFLSALPFCCCRTKVTQRRKSIRQVVTEKQTWSLICILTLPQLVLQVLIAALIDRDLGVELDDRGDNGRIVCGEEGRWGVAAGMGYAAFTYLIAVLVAWISRDLPSAFNEKDQVFQVATISTVLAFISIALLEILNEPTTAPDVMVFLRSMLSIGVAASVMLIIVRPKMHRVLSGEVVVVSTLLGARFSAIRSTQVPSSSHEETETETPVNIGGKVHQPEKRIRLKKGDPLPSNVETRILDVQSTLRSVTDKLGEGRALSPEEVTLLQGKVGALNHELDLVDMEGANRVQF